MVRTRTGARGRGWGVQLSYPRCGWSDLACPCGALALAALALAAHRAVAAGGALTSIGGASAGNALELSRDSYGEGGSLKEVIANKTDRLSKFRECFAPANLENKCFQQLIS